MISENVVVFMYLPQMSLILCALRFIFNVLKLVRIVLGYGILYCRYI